MALEITLETNRISMSSKLDERSYAWFWDVVNRNDLNGVKGFFKNERHRNLPLDEFFNHEKLNPLHFSTVNGFKEVVRYLLEKDMDVDYLCKKQKATALHYACWANNIEIAEILLRFGAELDIQNNDRKTAEQLATSIEMKNLFKTEKALRRLRPLITKLHKGLFDKFEWDEIPTDDIYNTPINENDWNALTVASCHGKIDCVRYLIGRGIGIDRKDKFGRFLLHDLVQRDQVEVLQLILDSYTINFDIHDYEGKTPIHLAIEGNKLEILEMLLTYFSKANYDMQEYYQIAHGTEISQVLDKFKPPDKMNELISNYGVSIDLYAACCKYEVVAVENEIREYSKLRNTTKVKELMSRLRELNGKYEFLGSHPPPEEFSKIQAVTEKLDWIKNRFDEEEKSLWEQCEELIDLNRIELLDRIELLNTFRKAYFLNKTPADSGEAVQAKLILKQRITDGRVSSGQAYLVKALYTGPDGNQCDVMVKLRKRDLLKTLEGEFKTMYTLYESNPKCFVKPYVMIKGWEEPISSEYNSYDETRELCGLVMEQGIDDLKNYLEVSGNISRLQRLALIEALLEIVIAAHNKKVVLFDFKPSNVVRFRNNETQELIWKAVDFDDSRLLGSDAPDSFTAEYASFEVAQHHVLRKGTKLIANTAMDVCSLGWIAWKIMKGRSVWSTLNIDETNPDEIIRTIANFSKAEVKMCIEKSFPNPVDDPIRSWLEKALEVHPTDRSSAEQLKYCSLMGTKEATISVRSLHSSMSNLNNKFDQASEKIAEAVSANLRLSMSSLETTLSRQIFSASENNVVELAQMKDLLKNLREDAQRNLIEAEQLKSYIQNQNSGELAHTIAEQVASIMGETNSNVGQSNKLDEILDMLEGMQHQMNEMMAMSKRQHSLLTVMKRQQNCMPHMFCIVPSYDQMKSDTNKGIFGNIVSKATHIAKTAANKVLELFCNRCKIVFICPVTLKYMVEPNFGYEIKIPKEWLLQALPIIKVGLFMLKAALSTQGLGKSVPNIESVLQSLAIDVNGVNCLIQSIDQVVDPSQNLSDNENPSHMLEVVQKVYSLMAKQESPDGIVMTNWKPTRTGLTLVTCRATGESAWVSREAVQEFERHGEAAFKNIHENRKVTI